jgi:hypothetical protein
MKIVNGFPSPTCNLAKAMPLIPESWILSFNLLLFHRIFGKDNVCILKRNWKKMKNILKEEWLF